MAAPGQHLLGDVVRRESEHRRLGQVHRPDAEVGAGVQATGVGERQGLGD